MTVSNQTNRTSAVGTGAAQIVPFTFPITANSDITVKQRITATGVETTLSETTNYTVTNNGESGGSITTVDPFIASTAQVHIIRDTPKTQTLDLTQGGSFNAEDVESGLDRNTKLIIENTDSQARSIKFPDTDPTSSIGDIPNSIDRASKQFGFDSAGKPSAIESVPEGSVAFSVIGTNIAEAADSDAVVTLLNSNTAEWEVGQIITRDPYVDVRSFGVTGDGATDDTATIAAAIAVSSGKKLFFPKGTYNHTGLTLNQKCHFLMAPGAKLFLIAGSDITSIIASVTGTIIEGGTIDGNRANQTAESSSAINVTADGITIRNVIIDDHEGFGVNARNVDDLKVHDCTITDTFFTGIYVQGTTGPIDNIEIVNNSIDRSAITASLSSILVYGEDATDVGTNVRIIGNYIKEKISATPTNIACITGRFLKGAVVSGNTCIGGYLGLSIDTSTEITQTGNTIVEPFFVGIEFAGLNGSTAVGNTIDGGSAYTARGITVTGAGSDQTRNVIMGNTITGIKEQSIFLSDDPDYVSIVGNIIEHSPTSDIHAAISLSEADYYVVSDNIIKGDGSANTGILLLSTGPGTVTGNTITNLDTRAIALSFTDGNEHDNFTITGNTFENTVVGFTRTTSGGSTFGDNVIIGNNSGATFVMNVTGHTTVQLTAENMKALRASPFTLIAAQGADTLIEFISATIIYDFTAVFTESTDNLVIEYASGTDVSATIETTGFLDQTNDEIRIVPSTLSLGTDLVTEKNDAIRLFNTGDGELGGTGSPVTVKVTYRVHTLGL